MEKINWLLIAFVCFLLFGAYTTVMLCRKNQRLIADNILSYGLFSAFYLLMPRLSLNIPGYILVLVMIAIVLHSYLGNLRNLYKRSRTFDRYLHAFGSFAFSLFTYALLTSAFGREIEPKGFAAVITGALGLAVGVIWELSEFFRDKLFTSRHQMGLHDTNFDLLFNFTGSALAALFVCFFY